MKHLLAVALLSVVALLAPAALATPRVSVVTIDFDTLGEEAPSQLCVAADFMTEPTANWQSLEVLKKALQPAAAPAPTWGSSVAGPADMCLPDVEPAGVRAEQFQKCVPGTGKGGVAVVYVGNAEVIGAPTLTESVARLLLGQSPTGTRSLVDVRLLGGDYWPDAPPSFPITDNAQLVRMTLRPHCFRRDVTLPAFTGCGEPLKSAGESAAQSLAPVWSGASPTSSSGDTYTLRIQNPVQGAYITANVCQGQHAFKAAWVGDKLPTEIHLDTVRFTFRWRTNCLSGDVCPNVGGDVVCATPGAPHGGVCQYTCSQVTRFPATVRFSFDPPPGAEASLEKSWTDTLTEPGQELESYIPADDRRVQITWQWNSGSRDDCSKRAADTLDYVQLRSPGGQLHNVSTTATQIRTPELDCGDSLSYRYVGNRLFQEVSAPVETDSYGVGKIVLKDPSESRTDKVGIAMALGAGGRLTGAGGGAQWGPYGEAQIILVFRQLRDWLPSNVVGIDFDLRGGAVFLAQPYCSNVVTTSIASATCSAGSGTWERVPFWLVPFTFGPNFLFRWNVTAGVGVGATFETFHLSGDAPKVVRPVLFTGVAHVGYRLTRAITAEAQVRLLTGEDIRERIFDEAGVLSDTQASGSGVLAAFGGVIRVDDLF